MSFRFLEGLCDRYFFLLEVISLVKKEIVNLLYHFPVVISNKGLLGTFCPRVLKQIQVHKVL